MEKINIIIFKIIDSFFGKNVTEINERLLLGRDDNENEK
jgi:hypothetical protein